MFYSAGPGSALLSLCVYSDLYGMHIFLHLRSLSCYHSKVHWHLLNTTKVFACNGAKDEVRTNFYKIWSMAIRSTRHFVN
jgi:hypothetical protein